MRTKTEKLETKKYALFKLTTTEIIVGELIAETPDVKSIGNPYLVVYGFDPNGDSFIYSQPYINMVMVDDKKDTIMHFQNMHILCTMNPSKDLLKLYSKALGSFRKSLKDLEEENLKEKVKGNLELN